MEEFLYYSRTVHNLIIRRFVLFFEQLTYKNVRPQQAKI